VFYLAYALVGPEVKMHVQEMISTHPDVRGNTNDSLIRCIEECLDCAQVCSVCADACLAEEHVMGLRQCIRLNLDCADICQATAAIGARRTGSNEELIQSLLQVCGDACAACAGECERHADMHEHCRICAETCRSCERACQAALKTFH